MEQRFDAGAAIIGLAFAVLGVFFLLEALDVADFRFELVLPAVAIVLGIGLIAGSLMRDRRT